MRCNGVRIKFPLRISAVQNVLKPDSDLVVLLNVRPIAVVPGPYGAAYMDFSSYMMQLEEHNRVQSHNILRKAAAHLKTLGFALKAISLRGDPRDELTRKVEELHVDLLVIGSRGLGAIKRYFMNTFTWLEFLLEAHLII
jgi:nucleotide-binding universal stress UspA family protein